MSIQSSVKNIMSYKGGLIMITEIPSVIFFSVNVLFLPLPHDVAVIPATDGTH